MLLQAGDSVGLVCCSDAHDPARKRTNLLLDNVLRSYGLIPVWSPYIYANGPSVFSGTGKQRAKAVMEFYRDTKIKAIFDLSGGNVANHILEYLDYKEIQANPKPFFGYSDLTTVLMAIYTKTGNMGYLYQLRNLIAQDKEIQQKRFQNTILGNGSDLWDVSYTFLRGKTMEGIVIGGNLRCLLKLAGTPYWPNFENKILFLEALGGGVGEISAMASQLKQIGVFSKIQGLLLGTFTHMEKEQCHPVVAEIFLSFTEEVHIPVAQTREIGHSPGSKGLVLGKRLDIAME